MTYSINWPIIVRSAAPQTISSLRRPPVPWLDTLRPPCKIFLVAPGFYVQFKYTLFGYNVVAICLQA